MVYAGSFDPNQMTEVFEDMRHRTSGVFGANFLIPEALRLRSRRDSRTSRDSVQACEGCRILLSPTGAFAGRSSA